MLNLFYQGNERPRLLTVWVFVPLDSLLDHRQASTARLNRDLGCEFIVRCRYTDMPPTGVSRWLYRWEFMARLRYADLPDLPSLHDLFTGGNSWPVPVVLIFPICYHFTIPFVRMNYPKFTLSCRCGFIGILCHYADPKHPPSLPDVFAGGNSWTWYSRYTDLADLS